MFSQTAEYALRAIVWLAEHKEECPVGNQQIANGTKVPSTYLAKILQELVKAELVISRRGVGGGFTFCRDPHETTVLDVVNAVDPINCLTECPLALKSHKHKLCSMHASLNEALEKVEEVLSNSSIADLLNDRSRPTPMHECLHIASTE